MYISTGVDIDSDHKAGRRTGFNVRDIFEPRHLLPRPDTLNSRYRQPRLIQRSRGAVGGPTEVIRGCQAEQGGVRYAQNRPSGHIGVTFYIEYKLLSGTASPLPGTRTKLSRELLAEEGLERFTVLSKLTNALVELVRRHLVLAQRPAELSLVVDVGDFRDEVALGSYTQRSARRMEQKGTISTYRS